MEFFQQAVYTTSVTQLQQHIRIDNLTKWCSLITTASASAADKGEIYCLWGEFKIHREILRDGIRFTLPGCPNALQWTITITKPGSILLHCTLNQQNVANEFSESIDEFLSAWKTGLENWKSVVTAKPPVSESCPTLFGGFG